MTSEAARSVNQHEFMSRWGMISFWEPSDPPCAPSSKPPTLSPTSGFRVNHEGSFYRYSGISNWSRPALWWEHLLVVTWGRLFWFQPREWERRWVVVLCDHEVWGTEFRSYRTKIAARMAAYLWLARMGRGTFYTPPYHLELFDALREHVVTRDWPLSS